MSVWPGQMATMQALEMLADVAVVSPETVYGPQDWPPAAAGGDGDGGEGGLGDGGDGAFGGGGGEELLGTATQAGPEMLQAGVAAHRAVLWQPAAMRMLVTLDPTK